MDETKPCPVDRGKLLIGLECCRSADPCCRECPYGNCRCEELSEDALAYIGWLEEENAREGEEDAGSNQ